ncbi:MAG TPA: alpha/beta hydrolase [Candidatus Krumholzibacteria bacterium]|nr:alpha/beta hydrolase [Candidatus Krumholzibacteria bacterium]HPD70521.1 alpha/beta hydrolase [Candidatus Krumholzibacteria bacterium]HRY39779.1 alpha/beta hydrolase [Candidatus Krumholzibacteria bacterium]
MYLITNRKLYARRSGLEIFGDQPNTDRGPNELRVVRCERSGRGWTAEILPDRVTGPRLAELREVLGLDRDGGEPIYTSTEVAERVMSQARAEQRNVLLFVHGYNNEIADALATARQLEREFNVIPLLFSWPANGGGIRGVASYLSDKRDAQLSAPAFSRVLEKVNQLMTRFTRLAIDELAPQLADLAAKSPPGSSDYHEARNRLLEAYCPVRLTLLTHSMGNYLLKKTLETSTNAPYTAAFDNVVLAAADTNNLDHRLWVDRLEARRRIYVTINEDDFALTASRLKPGDRQLARLGHYRRRLDSEIARYVDFTGADRVGNSHSYFADKALGNPAVKAFFTAALNGQEAEAGLQYNLAERLYRV